MNSKIFNLQAIILAFALFAGSPLPAQGITGKWKMVSCMQKITDKATGKSMDVSDQANETLKLVEQVIQFNADNSYTYSSTLTGSKKAYVISGNYKMSVNKLKLIPGTNNLSEDQKKYMNSDNKKLPGSITIKSLNAGSLTWHYAIITKEDNHEFISDMESTWQNRND